MSWKLLVAPALTGGLGEVVPEPCLSPGLDTSALTSSSVLLGWISSLLVCLLSLMSENLHFTESRSGLGAALS